MSRGALILFEGVDRCGKTTQARRLAESLVAAGTKAVFMRFPDRETPIGRQLNAYLTNAAELDDHVVHLLFAANRWEQRANIVSLLKAGTHVILDRYAYSGVAFTAAKPSMAAPAAAGGAAGATADALAWCKAPDAGLPLPDAVLFMDLPAEDAEARGGFGGERYETREMQAGVRRVFSTLEGEARALDAGLWHTVDARGTIEVVEARVRGIVDPLLGEGPAGVGERPLRRLWDGGMLE